MEAPLLKDIKQMKEGNIFQISPEGNKELNTRYAGAFIIATNYEVWGIEGYTALVFEDPNVIRKSGVVYLRAPWSDIEFVGQVEWLHKKKENENGKFESK